MSSPYVSFYLHRPLQETLRDIPPSVKSDLQRGFGSISKLSDRHHQLISILADSIGAPVRPEETAATLGISAEEIAPLLTAGTLALVSLGMREASATELIETATAAGVLPERDRPGVMAFCELVVTQRSGVRQALSNYRLSGVTLPVLTDFEITIDVRLGFEGGIIKAAVPVGVVHLDTDGQNQEVWFQVNKRRLERLVADLSNALKEMQAAERWIEQPRAEN